MNTGSGNVNADSGMVNTDSGKSSKSVLLQPEWLFTLNQNRCSRSPGMGVHDGPEYAVDAFEAGSARSARRVAKLRHQLEKAHLDAQAAEVTLTQWSETLLWALAEEVVTRFHSDALDDESNEDAIASFERMIERKVAELAPPAPLLRRQGSRIRPIRDYFIECLQKSLKNRW